MRPEPSGEVVLRRGDNGGVIVDHATPTMWFAQHALDAIQTGEPAYGSGWGFDGSLVTLDVDNGRWIWKLTGRSWCHDYGTGAIPLVMLEGVWPD